MEENDNEENLGNNSVFENFKSAVNSFAELGNKVAIKNEILSQVERSSRNTKTMITATVQIRGLSLKDALDLIPRFNGQNISLM